MDVKIAIVGSRSFNNPQLCWEILEQIKIKNGYNYIEVISGGARGADQCGAQYAVVNGIQKKIFPAEWTKYGKRAGYIRNVDIITNCYICIAFWDGSSRGTAHDLELCKMQNKICFVYNFITNELYIND